MTVALIGLPGSGKSTVGRQLAQRLQVSFFDSDHVIEEQLGCSIREYFEREGEERFRDVERQVIDELTQRADGVISTGGGAVLQQSNRSHLNERCKTVYLHCIPEEIFRRLRHDKKRPLLQVANPLKKLQQLYAVRDPLYRAAAHLVIETGKPPVSSLVNMIVTQLDLGDTPPALSI